MKTPLLVLVILCLAGCLSLGEAYAQTSAGQIQIRAGFAVEQIHVSKGQGSWVAMCFDVKGRLYASAEGTQGLFRVTPPPLDSKEKCKVELVSDQWALARG